jgi:hypothetical protein
VIIQMELNATHSLTAFNYMPTMGPNVFNETLDAPVVIPPEIQVLPRSN